jgi:hypothetical protein
MKTCEFQALPAKRNEVLDRRQHLPLLLWAADGCYSATAIYRLPHSMYVSFKADRRLVASSRQGESIQPRSRICQKLRYEVLVRCGIIASSIDPTPITARVVANANLRVFIAESN